MSTKEVPVPKGKEISNALNALGKDAARRSPKELQLLVRFQTVYLRRLDWETPSHFAARLTHTAQLYAVYVRLQREAEKNRSAAQASEVNTREAYGLLPSEEEKPVEKIIRDLPGESGAAEHDEARRSLPETAERMLQSGEDLQIRPSRDAEEEMELDKPRPAARHTPNSRVARTPEEILLSESTPINEDEQRDYMEPDVEAGQSAPPGVPHVPLTTAGGIIHTLEGTGKLSDDLAGKIATRDNGERWVDRLRGWRKAVLVGLSLTGIAGGVLAVRAAYNAANHVGNVGRDRQMQIGNYADRISTDAGAPAPQTGAESTAPAATAASTARGGR